MTLYLKAGPDGQLIGDCPFAQFVRLVLEEKGLDYELKPTTQETKPQWLVDNYDGKMPALRHRKECYVDSEVIAEYLDFFFPNPPLQTKKNHMREAGAALDGFFPSFSKYMKHTPDGDEEDQELKADLEASLQRVQDQLVHSGGPYLTGERLTLLDLSLAPKLYHLQTGLSAFKDNAIVIPQQFSQIGQYMDTVFQRDSFQKTKVEAEVVEWGWKNARSG